METLGTEPEGLFQVPYSRNPFFTGRQVLLEQVQRVLQSGRPVALSGLEGIGKSQTAIEYAYRYCDRYQCVLWLRAGTQDEFLSNVAELAQDLGLVPIQGGDQLSIVCRAVKAWFR